MGSVMWSRGEEVCVYDGKFSLVWYVVGGIEYLG